VCERRKKRIKFKRRKGKINLISSSNRIINEIEQGKRKMRKENCLSFYKKIRRRKRRKKEEEKLPEEAQNESII
jgi:hypothetical protein